MYCPQTNPVGISGSKCKQVHNICIDNRQQEHNVTISHITDHVIISYIMYHPIQIKYHKFTIFNDTDTVY